MATRRSLLRTNMLEGEEPEDDRPVEYMPHVTA